MPARIKGRMPTIPEYYSDFIDSGVNLNSTPKVCCPFHNEDTPSFSYSAERDKWRCFGSCKIGGDVVDLHRRNYKLESREDALESLGDLYDVEVKKELRKEIKVVNEEKVELEVLYLKCITFANCPDRWDQLDYIMSQYPVDKYKLQDILYSWGVSL